MPSDQTEPLPQPSHGGPHVVLLGAGASRAAFPGGDKSGRKLPLLPDLIEVCGLGPVLDSFGVPYGDENFEALYSRLATTSLNADCLAVIELSIFRYFERLEVPKQPTLYDHLVLSLREQDAIVTFNWDPFLWQALARVSKHAPTPIPIFLHGNVAVGYCRNHKPVTLGWRNNTCGVCQRPLEDSKLLYPVAQKNYNSDPFLVDAWSEVQRYLKHTFVFSIFGYSAPDTDVEAKTLLQHGWGNADDRFAEQIEIIDIKPVEELQRTWRPFIHTEHFHVCRSFYESVIAKFPRRSSEAMWDALLMNRPHQERPLPQMADWPELLAWFQPLIEQERQFNQGPTAK